MRNLILSVLFFASTVAAAPTDQDVPNLQQPRSKVYTAGQPTEQGLKAMVSDGVRTVINLRSYSETNARDETAELKNLGVLYINIPVSGKTMTLEKVKEFSCALRKNQASPVLLHCGSGNRVGGIWLLHRVLFEEADVKTALQEARSIGMSSELEAIVLGLLEEYRGKDLTLNCG